MEASRPFSIKEGAEPNEGLALKVLRRQPFSRDRRTEALETRLGGQP